MKNQNSDIVGKPGVSAAKQCPKCGRLSLTFKEGVLSCSSCSFQEKIPVID